MIVTSMTILTHSTWRLNYHHSEDSVFYIIYTNHYLNYHHSEGSQHLPSSVLATLPIIPCRTVSSADMPSDLHRCACTQTCECVVQKRSSADSRERKWIKGANLAAVYGVLAVVLAFFAVERRTALWREIRGVLEKRVGWSVRGGWERGKERQWETGGRGDSEGGGGGIVTSLLANSN